MPVAGVGEQFPLLKVANKTAAYTCTIDDCGTWFTNTGATASFNIQLPVGSTLPIGWWVGAMCCGSKAFGSIFKCTSPETIQLPGGNSSAGGTISQVGSGRTNGETIAIAWFGSSSYWGYIYGYPFDWSTA